MLLKAAFLFFAYEVLFNCFGSHFLHAIQFEDDCTGNCPCTRTNTGAGGHFANSENAKRTESQQCSIAGHI
jgi:hypothetical protein